jgi:negative regulator of replication initiation
MPQIDVTPEVYEALKRLTTDFQQTPNDVLASLLHVPAPSAAVRDPLTDYIVSPEFSARFTDADKYLALLAWAAARHPTEFQEFIFSLESGRRYLSRTREEIIDQCRHNQARQIPGTHYWAIMNIDTPTKRRFLSRVLEFCGYLEPSIEFACSAIGMRRPHRRLSFFAN